MATKGFKYALMGILDKQGNLVTDPNKGIGTKGIFSVNEETSLGTVGANMTGLEGAATPFYGSDVKVGTDYGVAQPNVVFSANDLPYDVYEKVLGHVYNGFGGYDAIAGKKPDVAMVYVSHSAREDKLVYKLFYHGTLSHTEQNNQSNSQNVSRVPDSLTYSPSANVKTASSDTAFYEADPNFDFKRMIKSVFPGAADDAVDEHGNMPAPNASPQPQP